MEGSTIVWIIVAVLVVLALAALVAALMKRRSTEKRRQEAERLRAEAHEHESSLRHTEVEAREAEARAARARLEAEQAEARAMEAKQGYQVHEATVEDRLREADRLDPHVDHSSQDYTPGRQETSTTETQTVHTPGPDGTPPHDDPGDGSSRVR